VTPESERLPRRDWLILPLLSVLALGLVLGISEIAARLLWPEHLLDRCAVHDQIMGLRFQPNCRSIVKSAEGPWLENSYNACGFRTAESCGPKPDGGFRVAVIGSSTGSGYLVPYDQTFFAMATASLKKRCHVPVDFQNLAVPGIDLARTPFHLNAALALKPNVVMMVVSGHDLEVFGNDPVPAAPADGVIAPPVAPAPGGAREWIRVLAVDMRASRAVKVAQHFLYQDLETYLPLYLQHGDEADFLRPPLSAAWQKRLALFNQEIDDMATRVRGHGAFVMLVFVPSRPQALLLHWKHLPSNIDPPLLGRDLGAIAHRHGVAYLDLTETIGDRPDVASLFYPLDSHPNGAANAIIAKAVVAALLARDGLLEACRGQIEAVQK
jgi:hypothetical protein